MASLPAGDEEPTGSLATCDAEAVGSPPRRSSSRGSGSETPSPGEESVTSGATDGDDGDDPSGYWLLCAVISSGSGLYVGEGQLGDLFCMLHTSDGVCRSRTVRAVPPA